jgi:hypothetical protein
VSFLREEESSRKEEGEWRRKRKGRKRKEKEKEKEKNKKIWKFFQNELSKKTGIRQWCD